MSLMTTDAQLAAELARDARDGLAAVYAAYADRLYSYAVTMLRDPSAAQDVVHDSLLAAAGSIDQLRDRSRFRPWLYAITRNECLRTIRGRRRFSDSDEAIQVPDESVDFDRGLRREEASRLVAQGMAAMSPADRDILSLAIQHDLDVDRLSLITGNATNALHARLSRARSGLSDALGALVLYRTRGRDCETLATILQRGDGPLTPLLRKRIQRHVKSCDTCDRRRRSALAALGPAMAAPVFLIPPESLRYRILQSGQAGEIRRLSERAAPFEPDGFPVVLDRRAGRSWVAPAVAATAILLVAAMIGTALAIRGQEDASAGSPPTVVLLSESPAPSASPSASVSVSDSPNESGEPEKPAPTPAADQVTPLPTAPITVDRSTGTTKTKKQNSPPRKPKATGTPKSTDSPAAPVSPQEPAPAVPAAPQAPSIVEASLKDMDLAADGSFTRCDAFTLKVTAKVSGDATSVVANVSPGGPVPLAGDPLQTAFTLPPGEYSVSIAATGPGGTTARDLGTVLHICPG